MEESLTVPARFVGHKDLGVGEGRLIVVLGPDGGTERGRLHVLLGYASLNHEAK
jgi:hypothetical protein